MDCNATTKKLFSVKSRDIVGGVFHGVALALVLYMPLPKNLVVPKWIFTLLLLLFFCILIWRSKHNKTLWSIRGRRGWIAIGLILSGLLLPLLPIPPQYMIGCDPIAFFAAGIISLIVSFAKACLNETGK